MNEMSKEFEIMMILLFVGHYVVVDLSATFLKQFKDEVPKIITETNIVETVFLIIRAIQLVINIIVYFTLKKYLG